MWWILFFYALKLSAVPISYLYPLITRLEPLCMECTNCYLIIITVIHRHVILSQWVPIVYCVFETWCIILRCLNAKLTFQRINRGEENLPIQKKINLFSSPRNTIAWALSPRSGRGLTIFLNCSPQPKHEFEILHHFCQN